MQKILVLGPSFFGYRDMVATEFRRMGYEVESMSDRPSESTTFKSLGRIDYRLVDSQIASYASRLADKMAGGSYDFLVYLGGMSFCFKRDQFAKIRSKSHAKFVVGLWDAFENCQRLGSCCDLFDEVYSFEPRDCARYNLKLRPLFYSEAYTKLPLVPEDGFKYDACFIGSVHQRSKFHAISKTCTELEERGLKVFKWYYMPSKSVETLRTISDPAYRGIEFKRDTLSQAQVADVYAHSRAIIDSPQAGQTGLTIRTLETLGARRKLITANEDVSHYDFYKYGNVVITGSNSNASNIEADFFDKPYEVLPEDVYESYSLHTFASSLLGLCRPYEGYGKETI